MAVQQYKREDWKDATTNMADRPDANRDPLTGAPGSHPVGAGTGAAAGFAAGALAGTAIAGPAAPVGAVIGGVIGAVAGGLAGKGVAEAVNPTVEDAYWRENFKSQSYYEDGSGYEDYRPAFEYGWEARRRFADKQFDDVEGDLRKGWEDRADRSKMDWSRARDATRDAWRRFDAAPPAESQSADTTAGAALGGVVGTGAGAVAGGAIGSAVAPGPGTVVGALTGAALGAAGGGAAGAELADTEGEAYWRENYAARPYYQAEFGYDDYLPAYRYGWQSRRRLGDRRWSDFESHLSADWERFKGGSRLTWHQAKDASRDAWEWASRKQSN